MDGKAWQRKISGATTFLGTKNGKSYCSTLQNIEHFCVQSFLTSIAPQIPNTFASNITETLAASGKKIIIIITH